MDYDAAAHARARRDLNDYGRWVDVDSLAPDTEPDLRYANDVALAHYDLKVRDAARRMLAEENSPPRTPLADDSGTLADMLRLPQMQWRIDRLLPDQGRMIVVAARKTGKTTLLGNITRSLLTGQPLLGRLDVRKTSGTVTVLNYEVSGRQLADWFDDLLVPHDTCHLVNLRGRRNPLADDTGRAELVELLTRIGTEVLVVDPFGRAYTGDDQNSAGSVAAWLGTLDQIATEAGCSEIVMAVHAGWGDTGRARGSSALEDWPDTIIAMSSDDDGTRYLSAEGRDVDIDEDALTYDHATRSLALTGTGGRKAAKHEKLLADVVEQIVEHVTDHPGATINDLAEALGRGKQTIAEASDRAVNRARLHVKKDGRALRHYRWNQI